MIITVVWQCMLIANIISEVTSKEEALNFSPSDISSWSTTGSQEGCGDSICPKGIKRCLLQKMKEKLVRRNLPTNDQPLLINLQIPKLYQKAIVNRRNLDVTLDKPLAISEIPSEETVIPTVSYQNTDYNFAKTEEIKNRDYPTTTILNNSFKKNSEELQTNFSNREVDDLDNSTGNYSLREIFHRNYHKYRNATYCKSNDTIMYINSDKEDEQLKSAPSNFPAMGENPQFKTLLPNVNNFEKYTSGEHANEDIIINNNNNNNNYNNNDDDDNNNPTVDFNNSNRQTSIGDGNGNPNENPFQAGNIPEYLFIDGQFIREDGVMNRAKPPGMNYNNNLTPKVTQYNFIDGQYIPENVNVQNQFRSDTETQTSTVGPNIQTEMNNLNNHKQIMMRPLGPLFVICNPIFTFYIEHNLPMYQANHLPNSKVNYESVVHVWVPQW